MGNGDDWVSTCRNVEVAWRSVGAERLAECVN